ncbi:hypothetical protein AX16_008429 [Volvariella volvacea WC 439]|nr:hypothetical protein AX16_008429 [Volvariella volvacea WC 439]
MHLWNIPLVSVLLSLLWLFAPSTHALHESDVGVLDWHKELIGVPITTHTSTAPQFHAIKSEPGRSLILSVTGNNVLAALEAYDGSVAWRHIFDLDDRIALYHKNEHVVATLSGPGGSWLRTFDILTGQLLLERQLHPVVDGHMSEPAYFGKSIVFTDELSNQPGLYVLTNGHTVNYIDGETGQSKWKWTSSDRGSRVINTELVATNAALYVIGLMPAKEGYKLHLTSLNPTTGEQISTADVSAKIKEPLTDYFVVHTPPPNVVGRVLWLENGFLKSIGLQKNVKASKPQTFEGLKFASIIDPGLAGHGWFVAVTTEGLSRIFKIFDDGLGVAKVWDYEGSHPEEATIPSIYAAGFDIKGRQYIARTYWSDKQGGAAADVYCTHLAEGIGLAAGFSFPFDSLSHGLISHIALESDNPGGLTIFNRVLVTSSTGSLQLWQHDQLQWTREEGLATIAVAEFVEMPQGEVLSSRSGESEGFVRRLIRQISDAKDFPTYLFNFVYRFATGSRPSSHTSKTSTSFATIPPSTPAPPPSLVRDTFGFRQVIVAATHHGKVYGIDGSNGEILWSRKLGVGWAAEVGGRIQPVKLFVLKKVGDVDAGESGNGRIGGEAKPEVVVVTQRRADNGLIDTVIFHLDALTGADSTGNSNINELIQGVDVVQGPVVEAYLVNHEDTRMVILLDEFLQVYLYPDTETVKSVFSKISPSLNFALRANTGGQQNGEQGSGRPSPQNGRLVGHQITFDTQLSDKPVGYPTWTFSLPPSEVIKDVIPPLNPGNVASLGKVLGNRTTLYKYLNSKMFIVLTAELITHEQALKGQREGCGIYLIDGVKGSVIYHRTVGSRKGVLPGGVCDIKAVLTENWLVYHYWDEGDYGMGVAGVNETSKGYRVVSVELYEGKAVDEKTRSADMSSYNVGEINLTAYERSWVFPHGITALTTTSTKFGITSKDIIVATENQKIQSFPRRLLNPRRPNRKPTTEELEEGLIQYDPVIPDDPRRVLSHNYTIAQASDIITSPSLLESTSLVFAFGLDLFLTRVSPSNTFDILSESFNKAQLVFTVIGLGVAIVLTKPMVQRKKLREKWYQ